MWIRVGDYLLNTDKINVITTVKHRERFEVVAYCHNGRDYCVFSSDSEGATLKEFRKIENRLTDRLRAV